MFQIFWFLKNISFFKFRRGDIEKSKRKIEGDLKLTQETVTDLERNRKELEQTIVRKDKEIASLTAKLEDEQVLVSKQQKQIKELQVSNVYIKYQEWNQASFLEGGGDVFKK